MWGTCSMVIVQKHYGYEHFSSNGIGGCTNNFGNLISKA